MGWQGVQCNVNKPVTFRGGGAAGDAGLAVWWLKDTMKKAGWSVVQSADGLAILDTTGDCLTVTSNIWRNGILANDWSNSNTWFVVRAPTGTLEIAFWRSAAAFGENTFQIKVDPGGFTDNALRSTTRPPDGTDQQCLLGALPATEEEAFGGSDSYAHAMACDEAVNGVYPWYLALTVQGTQAINGLLFFEAMLDPVTGDVAPWVGYKGFRATSGALNHIGGADRVFGWRDFGGGTELWCNTRGLTLADGGGAIVIPGALGTQPDLYYRGADINYASGAAGCWKGRGASVKWKGSARTYPDTVNVLSADDLDVTGQYIGPRLYFNAVLVPWPVGEVPL